MKAVLVACAVLLACGSPKGTPRASSGHVTDVPLTGDDRAALQAAIDAAARGDKDVQLEARTYTVSPSTTGYWCLDIPDGVHLHGAGPGKTVIREAAGAGPSVRLLHVHGAGVVIEDLTLDGNKAQQSVNTQRHGIFAQDTTGLLVKNVTALNFTGDGFYLYNGTKHSTFLDVLSTGNARNGITLGAMVDGTMLLHSRFIGNRAQQVDSEPGGLAVVSNTTVSDCVIDGAGVSNDYVLTVSGTPKAKGQGWNVVGNTINGGIFVVWAEHVVIAGNVGVNPTTKASVTVYRASSDVTVIGNRWTQTQHKARSLAGILVQGTGTGDAPARVLIAHNQLDLAYEQSFGVRAEGAIDVTIVDNALRGAGRAAPYYAGIYLRATNEKEDFQRAVVRGNDVRDFGERGVSIHGNGAARLLSVDISDNTFDNDGAAAPMSTAISLDDGSGAAGQVSVQRNTVLRGVRASLINVPQRAKLTIDRPPSAAP